MARLPAWIAKLQQKLSRSEKSKNSSSQTTSPEVEEPPSAGAREHVDEPPDGQNLSDSDIESAKYIEGLSKILSVPEGGHKITAIAPTLELMQRLQAAVQNNLRLKDAEADFLEHQSALMEEQEEVRAEGTRLMAREDSRVGRTRLRLDELEARDDEIIRELEGREVDLRGMWLGLREEMGELFEVLDGLFVRCGMLPAEAKRFETEGVPVVGGETSRRLGRQSTKAQLLSSDPGNVASGAERHASSGTVVHRPQGSPAVDSESQRDSHEVQTDRKRPAFENAFMHTFASELDFKAKLQEAVADNRHMKQFENRVWELHDSAECNERRIQRFEESLTMSRSDAPPANDNAISIRRLKQEQKLISRELDRFQAEAEVKWIIMRESLRVVLNRLDEIFVWSGEMDGDEGLRDIDNDKPMLEEHREQVQRRVSTPGASSGRDAGQASGVSPRGRLLTPRPTLSRKSKTHVDLRAEVQRLEDELSDRMKLEHQLLANYARARRDVEEAQRQFDLKEVRHDRETLRFQARQAAGEDVSCSPTEFDLKLLVDKRRLTRTLVEAEEDRDIAKAQAVQEGIHLGDDERSSGFVSRGSDGYGESQEVEAVEAIEREDFLEWMEQIPEGCYDELLGVKPGIDEWETESVEVWDSISVVAVRSERKRIDRWQKESGQPLVDL